MKKVKKAYSDWSRQEWIDFFDERKQRKKRADIAKITAFITETIVFAGMLIKEKTGIFDYHNWIKMEDDITKSINGLAVLLILVPFFVSLLVILCTKNMKVESDIANKESVSMQKINIDTQKVWKKSKCEVTIFIGTGVLFAWNFIFLESFKEAILYSIVFLIVALLFAIIYNMPARILLNSASGGKLADIKYVWRDVVRKEKKDMEEAEKQRKEEERRMEQEKQERAEREKARYEREVLLPQLREKAVKHEEQMLKQFGGNLNKIMKYADYSDEIEWFCVFNLRWKLYVKQFITDEGNIDYDEQYDILYELINLMENYHSILMEYYEEKDAIRQEFEVVKKRISPEKKLALKIEIERREEEAKREEKENEIRELMELAKKAKERGEEMEASKYFKQAGDMGDPEGCYQYAWYCDNRGRFTESKIYLLRAMDINPLYDNPTTREILVNLRRKEAIVKNS